MRVLLLPGTDPYRNLATEEHLLRTTAEDVLLLWRNDRTVVVGRNQNTLDEIDKAYADTCGIRVVRRISGGGTVYHDLSNVNFSFLTDGRSGADMRRFTEPVSAALRRMGVPAEIDGRNDILVHGRKVSGNAQALVGNRLLHHGTLLLDVDMETIGRVLTPHIAKLRSKGIPSVRSRVVGIRDYFPDMGPEDFMREFSAALVSDGCPETYAGHPAEIEALTERYASWAWNYGNNPLYDLCRTECFTGGTLTARLTVRKGRIAAVALNGDFMGVRSVDGICTALVGVPHRQEDIADALSRFDIQAHFGGITMDEVVSVLTFAGVL